MDRIRCRIFALNELTKTFFFFPLISFCISHIRFCATSSTNGQCILDTQWKILSFCVVACASFHFTSSSTSFGWLTFKLNERTSSTKGNNSYIRFADWKCISKLYDRKIEFWMKKCWQQSFFLINMIHYCFWFIDPLCQESHFSAHFAGKHFGGAINTHEMCIRADTAAVVVVVVVDGYASVHIQSDANRSQSCWRQQMKWFLWHLVNRTAYRSLILVQNFKWVAAATTLPMWRFFECASWTNCPDKSDLSLLTFCILFFFFVSFRFACKYESAGCVARYQRVSHRSQSYAKPLIIGKYTIIIGRK